jgi:hypothetical protein
MRRYGLVGSLMLLALLARPALAAADITAFIGASPTPDARSAKGVAIGLGLLVVGFEFEYGQIAEDEAQAAPELTTGMGNLVVMTPTSKFQVYGTTGGGIYHERYRDYTNTSFGTNVGGGIKIALVGPIRLRVDYRVFNLNGTPLIGHVHRVYAGVSLSF